MFSFNVSFDNCRHELGNVVIVYMMAYYTFLSKLPQKQIGFVREQEHYICRSWYINGLSGECALIFFCVVYELSKDTSLNKITVDV